VLLATAFGAMRTPGPAIPQWEVAGAATPITPGQILRTGEARITLSSGEFGRVDVAPGSELRIGPAPGYFRLHRGAIHAFIWAPPRRFVVDTPAARTIDLGCQYVLSVDSSGAGWLRVETGWVAFESAGRESFIPAGAECRTHPRSGPGTPFYSDAPESLRQALLRYDAGASGDALAQILAAARPRDAITLWHLLAHSPAGVRGAIFDRFTGLVALPPAVNRSRVLAGDRAAIDLCWDALNLENTGWWRGWKRPWR
jgi:hypothetical protein